jgi:hypothetical protein
MQLNPESRSCILHTNLTEVRIAPVALGVLIPQSGCLRRELGEEDEVSYCGGGGGNELVSETSPPYTRARETVVGDIQCLKGCGYLYVRRWTDVETSVQL